MRRDRPFVALNCGALPETLLESELFGHMRGAFTGAESTKKGLVEVAEGGTIFLDEIGEMTPMMQVKLLRVLQERKFRRVGGTEEISADIRVVAATNQDLPRLVSEGRFREDLYYRINVIPIQLPALRERREDIPLIAEHFLAKYREQMGKQVSTITHEAMALLDRYHWPGNIRELENVIERAVALERTPAILAESLPPQVRGTMEADLLGAGRRGVAARSRIRPRTARPERGTALPGAGPGAGRRRAGAGGGAAGHELPVVPLLRQEVPPEVGSFWGVAPAAGRHFLPNEADRDCRRTGSWMGGRRPKSLAWRQISQAIAER